MEPCLGKIGIVKRNAVEGKNRRDEIIKTYGLDERGTMVIDRGLPALSDLLAKCSCKNMVNLVSPQPYLLGPALYALCLLLCSLALCFETSDCCRLAIWLSFCCREQGCNDMRHTSHCAAMLFAR